MTMQDLGIIADKSYAVALNEHNQVVGGYWVNGRQHGFLWDNGVVYDLDEFYPSGINNSGYASGMYEDHQNKLYWPMFRFPWGELALFSLCQGAASAISDTGYITGWACDNQAFVYHISWGTGREKYIGSTFNRGICSGFGLGVNNYGQVAMGFIFNDVAYASVFDGVRSNLLPLTPPSNAWAINTKGLVVGRSVAGGPFIYNGVEFLNVTVPVSMTNVVLTSINDDGVAIGTSSIGPVIMREGVISDLGQLVNQSGVTLNNAYQINNLGQIAGDALFKGRNKAVRILP